MTDITSFIPTYPDIEDKNFGYEIARRKEFYNLRLEKDEPPPPAGEYLMTQEFMHRFISSHTQYTEMLIHHAVGTGKTCLAVAVAENFKLTEVGDKLRSRALVMVKSKILSDNFKREVSQVCTKNIYKAKVSSRELEMGVQLEERTHQMRLNKAISKTYDIVSFETFLPKMKELSEDAIKRQYSNRVIIIDEVHNLRIQQGDAESKGLYYSMHRFLHSVENCRVLLLTATPIWDKTNEIASLMNLILPMNNQFPTGSDFDAEYFSGDGTISPEKGTIFKQKIRGRVSYLRPMITSAKRIEVGQSKPWLKYIPIKPDGMSNFQSKVAAEAKVRVAVEKIKRGTKIIDRNIQGGPLMTFAKDASNFVFPDGTYGQEGFEKHCVKSVRNKKMVKGVYEANTVRIYQLDEVTRNAVREDLGKLSSKFKSIIDSILQNPKECVYIFCEQVTGSGAILFSLILKEFGFQSANSKISSKTHKKAERFAIITSDPETVNETKVIREVIDGFNEPENKYGEYLRVVIGSERIAQGISLKNPRQAHLLSAHWNMPYQYQAIARALRYGGQMAFPVNERYIKIFFHAAVESISGKLDGPYRDTETTDIYIYRIAEDKEKRNTQIYRLLKESAVDCALFYKRNVLDTDNNKSRDCDYMQCNYSCDTFPPVSKNEKVWDYSIPDGKIIDDNYNLYYSKKEVTEISKQIIKLFQSYFALDIGMIPNLLNFKDTQIILQSLDFLINNRILIPNRYGFGCYLKEQGDIYFLDDSISAFSSYAEATYIKYPLVTEKTSLEDLVEIFSLEEDRPKVTKFCKEPTENAMNELNYRTKIIMLENAYEIHERGTKLNKNQTAVVNQIMRLLGGNVHKMSDGNKVHILYSEEFTGLSYNVMAQNIKTNRKMRVLRKNGRWEYADEEEESKYTKELKEKLDINQVNFEDNKYGIYGTISKKDGKFRIVRKAQEGEAQKRGLVCESAKLPVLLEVFFNIHHLPEVSDEFENLSKEELILRIKGIPKIPSEYREDIDSKDEDELKQLLTLFTMKVPELCRELQTWFADHRLLLT